MPIGLTQKPDKGVLHIAYSQNQTYLLGSGLECGKIMVCVKDLKDCIH